jgi:hypothetical protein
MIWLGEDENGHGYLAFEALRNYAKKYEENIWVDDRNEAERTQSVGAAVNAVFHRPWFERTWIFQEAVLAKQATVFYGRHEIEWESLYRAAVWLVSCTLHDEIAYQLMTVRDITGTHGRHQERLKTNDNSHVPNLFEILFQLTASKSTDPRDKVYALLGIARNPKVVIPDYKKSVAEVYMETTRALIAESQSLQALNAAQPSIEDKDLPSWAADWRQSYVGQFLGIRLGCRF